MSFENGEFKCQYKWFYKYAMLWKLQFLKFLMQRDVSTAKDSKIHHLLIFLLYGFIISVLSS